MTSADCNYLPKDKPLESLFLPYFLPYALYALLGSSLHSYFAPWAIELVKLVAVSGTLFWYRRFYRVGDLKVRHVVAAIAAVPILLLLWTVPLQLFQSMSADSEAARTLSSIPMADRYFILRLINSVVLVAVAEELFCRVYVMEYLFAINLQTSEGSVIDRILAPLDSTPVARVSLPFSALSVIGSAILFAAGHGPTAWISAVVYFSATNWLYWKFNSVWICIIAHGATNLGVALLVRYAQMDFLWF